MPTLNKSPQGRSHGTAMNVAAKADNPGAGKAISRQGETRRIPVFVVVPPRLLLLDIAGPIEALHKANNLQDRIRFDVQYVGPRPALQTSIGLAIAGIEPLPSEIPEMAWIVLAGDVEHVMQSGAKAGNGQAPVDDADEAAIIGWLKLCIRPGHKLISICTGALYAGKAGLLDGYACTTHHASCAELARIAPRARVLENRLYVEDHERYSSAGITAGIDLMLHVIRQHIDHACTVAIARYLVVYSRRNGTDPQLSPWLDGRNHIHPAVHRVQDIIEADLTKTWTMSQLAKTAAASSRHLSRLFHEHVGMSVPDYSNRLRVEFARELLSRTRLDMERVAERVGFASARQLRRAWGRVYPTAPRHARTAYGLGEPGSAGDPRLLHPPAR